MRIERQLTSTANRTGRSVKRRAHKAGLPSPDAHGYAAGLVETVNDVSLPRRNDLKAGGMYYEIRTKES